VFELAKAFVTISADMNPLTAGLRDARGRFVAATRGMEAKSKVSLRLDTAGFTAGLQQARGKVDSWVAATNTAMGAAGTALVGIAAAGGAALAVGLYKGTQAAAGLNESLSKANAVFGPEAKAITDAADEMAAKFGTSRQTFVDMAVEAGILGQGLGKMANQEAAEFGAKITKLADDLVSFADVAGGIPEAMIAIKAGLRGETEPMSRFGVLLHEDMLKAEALRLGMAGLGKELTQQQKFRARVSLIETGLAKSKGDHERTRGSAKNVQREIGGRISNTLTDIGTGVLPVWGEILAAVNRAAQALSGFVAGSKAQMGEWAAWGAERVRGVTAAVVDLGRSFADFLGSRAAQSVRDGMGAALAHLKDAASSASGAVSEGVDLLGFSLRNVDDLSAVAGISLVESFTNAGETIAWAAQVAQDFGAYLAENWRTLAADAIDAVTKAVLNLGDNIRAVLDGLKSLAAGRGFDVKLKPVLEGFAAKSEPFKVRERTLTDYSDDKNRRIENIARQESARQPTKAGEPAGPGTPPAAGVPGAQPQAPPPAAYRPQFFSGGRDYSNAIQTAALASVRKPTDAEKAVIDTGKKQLAETQKTNKLLEEMKKGKKDAPVAAFG
jgi:hypothetical protein